MMTTFFFFFVGSAVLVAAANDVDENDTTAGVYVGRVLVRSHLVLTGANAEHVFLPLIRIKMANSSITAGDVMVVVIVAIAWDPAEPVELRCRRCRVAERPKHE